ncbi:hypothetical protein OPIT5_00220 (plasmid) [Opitutaceae bacterium TAV5]|nr:hypothetical protein OPIT5_00220 [Opitutaceae bacterium TAV5]
MVQEHRVILDRAVGKGILEKPLFYEAGPGCAHCDGTGFRGRLAIFELRAIKREIREQLAAEKNEFDLGTAEGVYSAEYETGALVNRSMAQDGVIKAALGLTTIEEVLAASSMDAS